MGNSEKNTRMHVTNDDPYKSLGVLRSPRITHMDTVSINKKRVRRKKLKSIAKKSKINNR